MVLLVNYIKQFNYIDKIFKNVNNIDILALTFKPQLSFFDKILIAKGCYLSSGKMTVWGAP